jgi:hypothetical protein
MPLGAPYPQALLKVDSSSLRSLRSLLLNPSAVPISPPAKSPDMVFASRLKGVTRWYIAPLFLVRLNINFHIRAAVLEGKLYTCADPIGTP